MGLFVILTSSRRDRSCFGPPPDRPGVADRSCARWLLLAGICMRVARLSGLATAIGLRRVALHIRIVRCPGIQSPALAPQRVPRPPILHRRCGSFCVGGEASRESAAAASIANSRSRACAIDDPEAVLNHDDFDDEVEPTEAVPPDPLARLLTTAQAIEGLVDLRRRRPLDEIARRVADTALAASPRADVISITVCRGPIPAPRHAPRRGAVT